MKGYSIEFSPEECAFARVEGVDASYKDLCEICGRIRNKNANWAVQFLEKVAEGNTPVLYKKFSKKIGHRRELGGKKGRYPKKAAKIVLKLLKSAIANGKTRGLGENYKIISAAANKKTEFPRIAPRGGWMRSNYELSRIEIVLKALEQPQKIEQKKEKVVEKKAEKKIEENKKSEENKVGE